MVISITMIIITRRFRKVKKKLMLILSISLSLLMIFFLVKKNHNSEEIVKLNSKLELVSENEHTRVYNFIVQSVDHKKQDIMMIYKEDVTFSLEAESKIEIPKDTVMTSSPVREKKEIVELNPQDEMIYTIEVDTEKLPLGVYELNVHFAAANVVVNDQLIEFKVE